MTPLFWAGAFVAFLGFLGLIGVIIWYAVERSRTPANGTLAASATGLTTGMWVLLGLSIFFFIVGIIVMGVGLYRAPVVVAPVAPTVVQKTTETYAPIPTSAGTVIAPVSEPTFCRGPVAPVVIPTGATPIYGSNFPSGALAGQRILYTSTGQQVVV